MNLKERPWFFLKINFYISRAFFMAAVTGMNSLRSEGVILLDKTDKNGLPNGDIHAAKVRFPTKVFSTYVLLA